MARNASAPRLKRGYFSTTHRPTVDDTQTKDREAKPPGNKLRRWPTHDTTELLMMDKLCLSLPLLGPAVCGNNSTADTTCHQQG